MGSFFFITKHLWSIWSTLNIEGILQACVWCAINNYPAVNARYRFCIIKLKGCVDRKQTKSACCLNAVWEWRRAGDDSGAGWSGDAPVQQEPDVYGVFRPQSLWGMYCLIIILWFSYFDSPNISTFTQTYNCHLRLFDFIIHLDDFANIFPV